MQNSLKVIGAIPRLPEIDGVRIKQERDSVTFIAHRGEDMARLKRVLSQTLTDIITKEYEDNRLSEYIKKLTPSSLPGEQKNLFREAKLAMEKMPDTRRTAYIRNRLTAFLTDAEGFSLEGFVNFRLKEYKKLLENTASYAVDVYLAKREYDDFIALLRLYAENQPPLSKVLHIVPEKDGQYAYFNTEGIAISPMFEGEDACMLSEDDRLLSTLISIAPEEITIHTPTQFHNTRLLESVLQIFANKVHFCAGCTLCQKKEFF